MNDLWIVASGAGLRDGLNPCIFMACAVITIYGQWLSLNSILVAWLRAIFGLTYAVGILVFNFGPAQVYVLQKNFLFTAKVLYFVLGVWSFVLGIIYFKDWFLLSRGLPVKVLRDNKKNLSIVACLVVFLTTAILGLALSALATFWPANQYMVILGNATILKGQGQAVMPLLATYALVSMWPLWMVWSLLSIKNLRPSMLKILCAAIFFTASTCMIFIMR